MEETEQPKETDTATESLKDTVERLEKANAETARLLQEQKELEATRILHGGVQTREAPKPVEETDAEYRVRIEREIREGKFN